MHIWHLKGILVSCTCMAIVCEVVKAVGCVLAHIGKILGLYAHLALWLCDLYLQCDGSHIFQWNISNRCTVTQG